MNIKTVDQLHGVNVMNNKHYLINEDTGVNYQDIPPWRSYTLYTEGYNWEELVKEAWIEEVDQDGGTIADYPLAEASDEVLAASYTIISSHLLERVNPIASLVTLPSKLIFDIIESGESEFYPLLNYLFSIGYTNFSPNELLAIKNHLDKMQEIEQLTKRQQ